MPQHQISLTTPGGTTPFPTLNLQGNSGNHAWSVRSYTLQGGLQNGVDVIEVDNGALSFAVLPTRGMSIWKGRFRNVSLGWDSPVREPVHPSFINAMDRGGLGWLKGFNEWFVRCGLSSMGAPCTDTVLDYSGNALQVPLTLHGNIANLPARSVTVEVTEEGITVRGEVDETMMFGPALRLATEICTTFGSGQLAIHDTVSNLGKNPTEHQLLYHINYGGTLLEAGSRVLAPFAQVAPRDPRAAEGIEHFDRYGPPTEGFVEQAYFYELLGSGPNRETMVLLRNAAGDQGSLLRFSLNDFPCFTLWKNTASRADGYVTGLEPATSYPNPRHFERERGRVLTLAGGTSRSTRMILETVDDAQAVHQIERDIQTLQEAQPGRVHPQPIHALSRV